MTWGHSHVRVIWAVPLWWPPGSSATPETHCLAFYTSCQFLCPLFSIFFFWTIQHFWAHFSPIWANFQLKTHLIWAETHSKDQKIHSVDPTWENPWAHSPQKWVPPWWPIWMGSLFLGKLVGLGLICMGPLSNCQQHIPTKTILSTPSFCSCLFCLCFFHPLGATCIWSWISSRKKIT